MVRANGGYIGFAYKIEAMAAQYKRAASPPPPSLYVVDSHDHNFLPRTPSARGGPIIMVRAGMIAQRARSLKRKPFPSPDADGICWWYCARDGDLIAHSVPATHTHTLTYSEYNWCGRSYCSFI